MRKKNNQSWQLLPYQHAWINDQSPVRVCEKSRRVGISWAEAYDCALLASTKGKAGMDTWYIGYNKDMALEFIRAAARWATDLNLAAEEVRRTTVIDDEDKDILAYRIRFSTGHRITALSSSPSNLRGKQGKVVIDEAAFHDDLEELMKAAIALLMWGGRLSVISTHNGDDNPFNDLVNDIRTGKNNFSLHRITLDDALKQGLYRQICRSLGNAWSRSAEHRWREDLFTAYGSGADEELNVIPSRGEGAYLSRALVESCMDADIPVVRWEETSEFAQLPKHIREADTLDKCERKLKGPLSLLDPDLRCYFGEDFARSGHLTVIVPLQEQPDLVYKAPFVLELRNVPFEQQKQILFFLVDRLPRFSLGALDAGGNGQYLAEVAMQRYGAGRIAQVHLSTEWYRENMPRYKAAFEDKTICLPKSADILEDHRAVRMEKGIAKVPNKAQSQGTDGGKRHGDSALAGALALFAVNQPVWEVAYESVSKRRSISTGGAY